MQFTIKQARLHAGLTQECVAKHLGIDRGTYIRIEKDPEKATVKQINMISEITGIPLSNIFLCGVSINVEIQETSPTS